MTPHPSFHSAATSEPGGEDLRNEAGRTCVMGGKGGGFAALVEHRIFLICAIGCLVAFVWICTGGTGQLIARDSFGDFYDHQTRSILMGRLDVPFEVISFEAFVFEGKYYGYFGPTPALLRIPFVLAGVWFGQLSRPFLVAHFASALIASYLILLHAVRLLRDDKARPHPVTIIVFMLSAGLGSTILFLGSRAYVYHEAILCGAAFALWAIWFALRHLATPAGRWWIGSIVCGLLSVHARPPTGLLSLAVGGTVGAMLAWQQWQSARRAKAAVDWSALRRPFIFATLSLLAVVSYNGVSYLKFRTIDGCPLRLNVQYDEARLAKIDGSQFHLSNFLPNAAIYLFRPGLAGQRYFPYLFSTEPEMPAAPAKLDLVEPMVGIPFAMPALAGLATLGCAAAFVATRRARIAIAALWLGASPMGVSMFCAIALTQRYTADFCPALITAAAIGLAWVETLPRRARVPLAISFGPVVACNVLLMFGLTLRYQGEGVWGVPAAIRQNYAALREKADAFWGLSNPAGYSIEELPIRALDVDTALALPQRLAQVPAFRPLVLELAAKARRDHADDARLVFALGEVYLKLARFDEAMEAFDHARTIDPRYSENFEQLQAKLPPRRR